MWIMVLFMKQETEEKEAEAVDANLSNPGKINQTHAAYMVSRVCVKVCLRVKELLSQAVIHGSVYLRSP